MRSKVCRLRLKGRALETVARDALGIVVATVLFVTLATAAFALDESPAANSSPAVNSPPASTLPSGPPATKLVPSDESEPAPTPSEEGATGASAAPATKPRTHHKTASAAPPEVEPATARLRVVQDGWIYAAPSKTSRKIEKTTIGKYVDVTGSTKYYLQAKLRDGQTGYISPSEVELVKPTDKVFLLTRDAAVLDAPNHWAKKLTEVHSGHHVHVVGLALGYMRIRMKSGVTGFIPVTALQ